MVLRTMVEVHEKLVFFEIQSQKTSRFWNPESKNTFFLDLRPEKLFFKIQRRKRTILRSKVLWINS